VDHPAGRQPAAGRGLRVAGLAAAEPAALREDLRAAGTVDRAVYATAAEQRLVGRVDDGVDLLRGQVADDEGELTGRGYALFRLVVSSSALASSIRRSSSRWFAS
jgi:hypothetical protein